MIKIHEQLIRESKIKKNGLTDLGIYKMTMDLLDFDNNKTKEFLVSNLGGFSIQDYEEIFKNINEQKQIYKKAKTKKS